MGQDSRTGVDKGRIDIKSIAGVRHEFPELMPVACRSDPYPLPLCRLSSVIPLVDMINWADRPEQVISAAYAQTDQGVSMCVLGSELRS